MGSWFDVVAKALAGGTTRRETLRQIVPRVCMPAGGDGTAFDHLAMALAEAVSQREACGPSRRQILRILAIGVATALLPPAWKKAAWAQGGCEPCDPRNIVTGTWAQLDDRYRSIGAYDANGGHMAETIGATTYRIDPFIKVLQQEVQSTGNQICVTRDYFVRF